MKTICLLLAILGISQAAAPADNDASWQTATKGVANDATKATAANFELKFAVDDQPVDHDLVHFILTGTSPGYMSFGIMNGPEMANIDIITFEDAGGSITVTDRYSQSKTAPTTDTDNGSGSNYLTFDSTNSSFNSSNNLWTLRWSRRLETDDSAQDIPLYCDKNPIVIATADSPTFTMHSLYQYFDLDIQPSVIGGCNAAPEAWADWFYPPDGDDDDDVKDSSSLLQISIFLAIINLFIV